MAGGGIGGVATLAGKLFERGDGDAGGCENGGVFAGRDRDGLAGEIPASDDIDGAGVERV
ncbi:hypothetical protein OK142_17940 [Agrobacterium sp. BT-220-3]|jgi:hypothetical protein|nr:hypothetical protein [Agrobacterium sp. BT-220-3]